MLFRKSVMSAALAAVAGLGIATSSWGATTTGTNLNVQTTVVQKCTIGTTPIDFGNYDPITYPSGSPLAKTGTGSISVTCTQGATSVVVGITLGQNAAATAFGARALHNGTNMLGYDIFQPSAAGPGGTCAGTTSWTPAATVATSGSLGILSPLSFNVCGSIAGGQDVSQGVYTDIVSAQVTF
jgi:spore coat protein U-like protein